MIGFVQLRGWLGPLGDHRMWAPLRRVGATSVAMGAVVLVVINLSDDNSTFALLLRVIGAIVAGGLTYVAVAAALGARAARARPGGAPGEVDMADSPAWVTSWW